MRKGRCPRCSKRFRLPDTLAGRAFRCPACGMALRFPRQGAQEQRTDGGGAASTSASSMPPPRDTNVSANRSDRVSTGDAMNDGSLRVDDLAGLAEGEPSARAPAGFAPGPLGQTPQAQAQRRNREGAVRISVAGTMFWVLFWPCLVLWLLAIYGLAGQPSVAEVLREKGWVFRGFLLYGALAAAATSALAAWLVVFALVGGDVPGLLSHVLLGAWSWRDQLSVLERALGTPGLQGDSVPSEELSVLCIPEDLETTRLEPVIGMRIVSLGVPCGWVRSDSPSRRRFVPPVFRTVGDDLCSAEINLFVGSGRSGRPLGDPLANLARSYDGFACAEHRSVRVPGTQGGLYVRFSFHAGDVVFVDSQTHVLAGEHYVILACSAVESDWDLYDSLYRAVHSSLLIDA